MSGGETFNAEHAESAEGRRARTGENSYSCGSRTYEEFLMHENEISGLIISLKLTDGIVRVVSGLDAPSVPGSFRI